MRSERGSAFILMLAISLGMTVLIMGLWEVLRVDWQIIGSQKERWIARYLAEAGIERGFELLTEDSTWSGTFQEEFPASSGNHYYVDVVNDGVSVTIRSHATLASGYDSETIEVQAVFEKSWPWEI